MWCLKTRTVSQCGGSRFLAERHVCITSAKCLLGNAAPCSSKTPELFMQCRRRNLITRRNKMTGGFQRPKMIENDMKQKKRRSR